MLTNVPAPYWSWTLAYSFHEGRTPTRGHEATIEATMQAFEKLAQGMSGRHSPQWPNGLTCSRKVATPLRARARPPM